VTIIVGDMASQPKMFRELASWFHLLTAPHEYAEEAERYRRLLVDGAQRPVREVLELGSGGGNNASHLKGHFAMTLTDLSEDMLAVSRELNPECEHLQGDMRTLRLDRNFDGVFAHDAVSYMTTRGDLRAAVETAFVHLRPGGVALFVPDHFRETFRSATEYGGHDGDGRAARYLEWDWDPDPSGEIFVADFAYLLREGDRLRVEQDHHVCGLFSRDVWLQTFEDVGFRARAVATGEEGPVGQEAFVAVRPRGT
jgi:SAM-dependent methyltransferase